MPVRSVEDAFGMGILFGIGNEADLRHQMLAALVEVPVFLARDIGIMRMGEADRQHPGPRIKTARQVVDLRPGLMGNVVIVFQLVGDLGHPGAGDRPHVVIPPVDPLARLAVVRGPAEIGGVDVGGQPFLEPVQLVGADEMHLARQRGEVARPAQVVGIGGDVRAELGGVVIDPGARGQLPRHERGPRRGAQRRGGIGIGESHRARGQFLQVRRMQPVRRAIGKQRAVQLIDHQHQDVRAGHVRSPCASSASKQPITSSAAACRSGAFWRSAWRR